MGRPTVEEPFDRAGTIIQRPIIQRQISPFGFEGAGRTYREMFRMRRTKGLGGMGQLTVEEPFDHTGTMVRSPPVELSERRTAYPPANKYDIKWTRSRFPGSGLSPAVWSDDRVWTTAINSPIPTWRSFSEDFGEGAGGIWKSNIGYQSSSIVRDESVISKLLSTIQRDQKAIVDQISKRSFENPPDLDFAEVAGRTSELSDPKRADRRYPRMEHVESPINKIIKEIEVVKEDKSDPLLGGNSLDLNLNRISDQIYSMIERRIKIERERRGIYG